ncbi:MAG: hypothetical protein PF689_13715 [Deltaproteobacteria bacterium]|jgi:hypothetical protein|nr:hypothetical protein [Deltaproteobacteria bacterium]
MTNIPLKTGSIIYPVKNSNGHNYIIGNPYIVTEVDDDGTFKAKDPNSNQEGNWLKWDDVSTQTPIGWHWLKENLSPEDAAILSLFKDSNTLLLKDEAKDALLRELEDLPKRMINLGKNELQTQNKTRLYVNYDNKETPIIAFPENTLDLEDDEYIPDEDYEFEEEPFEDLIDKAQQEYNHIHGKQSDKNYEENEKHPDKDNNGNNLEDD